MRDYEIWTEGYSCTGDGGGAYKIGDSVGDTFREAVELYFKNHPDDNFNKERLTVWSCRLFDNRRDAQRNFG